jgi:transposase
MARRSIEMHEYRQVLMRLRQGDSEREIARSGLMGRAKAARFRELAREKGWLELTRPLPPDAEIAAALAPPRVPLTAQSTLAAYRPLVAQWLGQGVSGVAIHAALAREHGFTGHYSSVRRLIAAVARELPPDTTVRLSFDPGEAAQVDFGAGPELIDPATGQLRRTWAFVMTLAFSRHQYVEFVWDQSVRTWLACHQRAFDWFGAVPARLIIDNAKCAITRACARDPEVQRAYAECAEGYGFRIDACPPRDPQKKGIVEAGVKYVKGNFLPTRRFRDMTDLNAQVRDWVLQVAGQRTHGTTRVKPLESFAVERALLLPLPAVPPDLGSWHQVAVHRDCHVSFERGLYSVPFALVGKRLWLRATDSVVTLYQDFRPVAIHARSRRPGERRTVTDHLPPEARTFFAHDRAWCLQQAAGIGPACVRLIQRLLSDRVSERLRAAQGVLHLKAKYGAERLEAACARALEHDSPHYRTVKTILVGGHDLLPATGLISTEPYAGRARFARGTASLFADEPPSIH